MNPNKSGMFATSRRASVDSDGLNTDLTSEAQSVSGTQIWSSSPRISRRATTSTHREPQSCASQSSDTNDCATRQFLIWAAIKRNRSVKMPASERLKCPLLLCDESFSEHESMLRHLSNCRHLRTGEYLCWECTKVERYNDGKCRCCTSQPSKRRRIVKLAKNFFSNIGTKSRRIEPETEEDDDRFTMPPPAYDGMLTMPEEEEEQSGEFAQFQIELNNTEVIGELDSGSIHQLDPINYGEAQGQLAQPPSRTSSNSSSHLNLARVQHCPNTTPFSGIHKRSVDPHTIAGSPAGSQRPSLALNTEVDQFRKVPNSSNNSKNKYLTPSSSIRSQHHPHSATLGISPITPWSANSGISGTSSGSWTLASSVSTQMTSPTSPNSAYANNGTLLNNWDVVQPTELVCNPKDVECGYYDKGKSKMPGDCGIDSLFPNVPDHVLFPTVSEHVPEKDTYSWQSSVNTEISLVNVMSFDDTPAIPSDFDNYAELTPATDAGKLLIGSAWDALRQHVESSHAKVVELGHNPLAVRFRQESPTSVATKGFESLRNLLNGTDPSDPLDYLCFVHVVYAFSLVLHEDGLTEKSISLFRQALAYRGFLDARWYRVYTQVVARIWDPETHAVFQNDTSITQRPRPATGSYDSQVRMSAGTPIETDVLAVTSQNFLDEFESLVLNSKSMKPTSITSSELWSIHMADQEVSRTFSPPFAISAEFIMKNLSHSFSGQPGLAARLKHVGSRVRRQQMTTVRGLEMELMQAGKAALDTSQFFDQYVPQCRQLCTPLYSEHSSNSRTRYHTLAASFAEQMLQSFATEILQPTNAANLPVTLPGSLEDIFGPSIDGEFSVGGDIGSFLQPPPSDYAPRYSGSIPAGILDFSSLQAGNDAPYQSNNYSHSSVSTPGLVAGSQSPPPTVSVNDVSMPPRKRPHSIIARPKDAEVAAGSSSSASVASSSKQLAAIVASPGLDASKIEANSCCEICGYRPKGDPQWFKGSMAKHKKLQHSKEPPTIYRCPYPGCTSAYKNRQDNLRQHQIEKNHFVDDDGSQKRPQKRKRMS